MLIKKVRRLIENSIWKYKKPSTQISCSTENLGLKKRRYVICPDKITKESVVYSFGIGNNVSFDLSIIEKIGVNVYAFDPTPKSINWVKSQKLPERFHFFEYGIADFDGIAKFSPPKSIRSFNYTILERSNKAIEKPVEVKVYKLKTIMNMLGHDKIDILKLDIEGAEYSVIEDLINSNIEVYQLLVEFHHRFAEVGAMKTKRAIELLNKSGFKIFHISPKEYEYSFIHI